MIFDTSAACTAMPSSLGEGYEIIQDELAGGEHGGVTEGKNAVDKGRRVIRTLNEKWKAMRISHRVMDNLKVSAGLSGRNGGQQ